MKVKINVKDNINNKTIQLSKELPSKDHLEAQIRYPKLIQRDKTKYNRKKKYKEDIINN